MPPEPVVHLTDEDMRKFHGLRLRFYHEFSILVNTTLKQVPLVQRRVLRDWLNDETSVYEVDEDAA